jgi:hypothetical protein
MDLEHLNGLIRTHKAPNSQDVHRVVGLYFAYRHVNASSQ